MSEVEVFFWEFKKKEKKKMIKCMVQMFKDGVILEVIDELDKMYKGVVYYFIMFKVFWIGMKLEC